MDIKEELIKLREKIKGAFTSESVKELETMAKKEDPLGYGALGTTIGRLIESKNETEDENKALREQLEKMSEKDRMKYWASNFRHFNEQTSSPHAKALLDHFKNSRMIILDDDSDIKDLDWNEFYNTKAFINSLPWSERYVFSRPKYQDIVYWNRGHGSAHLHLTRNGFVEWSEYMDVIPGIANEDLEGKNIKEVVSMLKEKGIKFPENNEFEKAIKDYDNWIYQKDEMLNCVMYRIIERGGNRIGPRRAFIFAKEFGRNIDIPMAYGVDRSDPGLRLFMNEYIKAGGSKNLVCYIGYGSRASKYEKLPTITIQELIMTQNNNAATFYTPEEDELHQRLVNALSNRINQDDLSEEQENLKKEEVRQLRLQRKLEKSKQTGK